MATIIQGSANSTFGGTIESTGIDDNATSTAITIDANENVGIGTTPESWNSGWKTLQIGDGASIAGRTVAGNVDISSNAYRDLTDNRWEYIGANGSEEAAKYTQFDGTHVFYTAPAGSADSAITFSTKATIDTDGLKFNGDTAAANALDDFEEGTWTPILGDSAGNNTWSGTASGSYVKIGKAVMCTFHKGTSGSNSSSSTAHIKGLPFTSTAVYYKFHCGGRGCGGPTSGTWVTNLYMPASSNYLQIQEEDRNAGGGAGTNAIQLNEVKTDGSVSSTFWYYTS